MNESGLLLDNQLFLDGRAIWECRGVCLCTEEICICQQTKKERKKEWRKGGNGI